MTTREKLHQEVDKLDEESVDAVYRLVRQYAKSQPTKRSGDLLTRLQEIKIEGPEDFSENLDLYLYGEKRFPDDVH